MILDIWMSLWMSSGWFANEPMDELRLVSPRDCVDQMLDMSEIMMLFEGISDLHVNISKSIFSGFQQQ
ncbi:hypothetical protein FRX31_018512 [Thalictrum thalictroides]|uniref:Uncharacterized protein n=1 Tax=Thalictrum thalictroides TaxID=46969 RepID=A0A7J6W6D8_THATH|nr:hypothetical protein FRX31_018512 [Thalictrum thalictroides]